MRTRCPACATIFRITAEQLRARGGKVRCGACKHVFNAFENLVPETKPSAESRPAPVNPPPATPPTSTPAVPASPQSPPFPALFDPEASGQKASPPVEPSPLFSPAVLAYPPASHPIEVELIAATAPVETIQKAAEKTPEKSTEAARQAGLVAAREMTETPGYNRWAADALTETPGLGLEPPAQRAAWPFALVALVLFLALAGQLAYHYRTELTQRLPQARGVFEALSVDIPLPRQTDLVHLESSDLQSDKNRGMLVLQASLRNYAPYDQAWPALELTLTDANDKVVARRILQADDYLPPGASATVFSANAEVGVRLWIEAKDLAAAGYRLYLFYP